MSRTFAGAALVTALLQFGSATRAMSWQAPAGSLPAPVVDVQKLGPQVGTRVPDFALVDQEGQRRTLASLGGPKGLMLVFVRSADWDPYCKSQLIELQSRLSDLKRNGFGLVAISYDPVPVLAEFAQRRAITFRLLSDPGSATINRFGILNTTEKNPHAYGTPFPGTFMLNSEGVVTARFFEPAYQERTSAGSILVRLDHDVDVPATRVSSPQMDIATFASDATVAPGTHFSLVLDLSPSAGVHVYAPGVKGYKPLTLRLQAQPGVIIGNVRFPQSEIYHFEPLNEYVQVFQRPFRVIQDVAIDPEATAKAGSKEAGALTIKGQLDYQACDDQLCLIPQSVPLSWNVTLRPLNQPATK
jgi:peroxiredoxin